MKKRRKTNMEKCLPLELTQKIADKYPGCWDQIEEFWNDDTLPEWTRRCYDPLAATMAIVKY